MSFFERLMYVDGVTPVNCVISARLYGVLSEERLRNALDKVQAKHPMLRATVIEENGVPYFAIRSRTTRIPLRTVRRSTEDDWRKVMLDEWQTPFPVKQGPLVRLVWLRSDGISELMLVGHHCVCDGLSLVSILREILQLIDQPDVHLASYLPVHSVRDIVPKEILASRRKAILIKGKAALFRLFAMTIKEKTTTPEGKHYLIYWKADASSTEALKQRCRVEQTTPYAALCVAFMQGFRQIMGTRFKNKVMCPVNIRRYIPSIHNDMMFNYAPTIALRMDDRPNQRFWEVARSLKEAMNRKIDNLDVYEHLLAAEELHASVPKLISLLRQSKGSYDCAFSNMGRIDIPKFYHSFTIDCFLGITVALPWRNSTTLVTSHFDGKIDLSFIANDGFIPYAKAMAIKEVAIEILVGAIEHL